LIRPLKSASATPARFESTRCCFAGVCIVLHSGAFARRFLSSLTLAHISASLSTRRRSFLASRAPWILLHFLALDCPAIGTLPLSTRQHQHQRRVHRCTPIGDDHFTRPVPERCGTSPAAAQLCLVHGLETFDDRVAEFPPFLSLLFSGTRLRYCCLLVALWKEAQTFRRNRRLGQIRQPRADQTTETESLGAR
jgi:hypothetical protein